MENLEKGQVSERNVMEDAGIMLNSDYCTGEEKFTFFRLPKCLVDNVCFAELSGDAKLLYSFFLGIWRGNPRPFNDRDESAACFYHAINLPKA